MELGIYGCVCRANTSKVIKILCSVYWREQFKQIFLIFNCLTKFQSLTNVTSLTNIYTVTLSHRLNKYEHDSVSGIRNCMRLSSHWILSYVIFMHVLYNLVA